MKVHNNHVHQTQNFVKENLKFIHCNTTCSDLSVMIKQNECEHKFKCTLCNNTLKEEHLLKTHSSTSHAQKKRASKAYINNSGGKYISQLVRSTGCLPALAYCIKKTQLALFFDSLGL